jgi:uroporphyrinogen-III decarboxylase
MTSRERLVAAARGGEVDRQPVICWPGGSEEASDAIVVSPKEVQRAVAGNEERVVLGEVPNPFGLATEQKLQLNALLEQDPERGNALLEALTEQVRDRIDQALGSGADGILYRLHGAHPSHTSPMQYGGYYLERDRELLEAIKDARLNMVFVVGGEGVYIDFVSDLPAHVFGWDETASGVDLESIREMRQGALATTRVDADVRLETPLTDLTTYLETQALAAV